MKSSRLKDCKPPQLQDTMKRVAQLKYLSDLEFQSGVQHYCSTIKAIDYLEQVVAMAFNSCDNISAYQIVRENKTESRSKIIAIDRATETEEVRQIQFNKEASHPNQQNTTTMSQLLDIADLTLLEDKIKAKRQERMQGGKCRDVEENFSEDEEQEDSSIIDGLAQKISALGQKLKMKRQPKS